MIENSQNSIPDNVNEKWREKFSVIEKCYNNGNIFSAKKNIDKNEFKKEYKKLLKLDTSLGLAILFGPFYYLFKGLWLKAIIYAALINCLVVVGETFLYFPSDSNWWIGLNTIWPILAPFDYYRLKILKKQW